METLFWKPLETAQQAFDIAANSNPETFLNDQAKLMGCQAVFHPVFPMCSIGFQTVRGTASQLFGVREQARLPLRHHITTDTKETPKLKILIAAAALAAFLVPAQAEDMPFEKATAYREAIETWCFETLPPSVELARAADIQDQLESRGIWKTLRGHNSWEEKADLHLHGDQSACAPAIAFVERITAEAVERLPELNTRLAEAQAEDEADAKAKVDAEIARQEQALAEAEADRVRKCGNLAEKIGADLKAFDAEKLSANGRRAKLQMWSGWLDACHERLTANVVDPLLAEIDRHRQ